MKLDLDVLEWVVKALKESHQDEKDFHNGILEKTHKDHRRLKDRLDTMDVDKLDGKISTEFFERKSVVGENERNRILEKIEAHEKASRYYLKEGAKILELSQKAVPPYERQEMHEKRKLTSGYSRTPNGTMENYIPNLNNPLIYFQLQIQPTKRKRPSIRRKTT